MVERATPPIIRDEEPEPARSSEKIEEFSFDDLDKEVGLGDMLKERESVVMLLVKKITFALIVLIVSVIVFFASFTIGKLMFLTDSSSSKPSDELSEMSPVPAEVAPTENVVIVPAQDQVASQTSNTAASLTPTVTKAPPAPEPPKPTLVQPKVLQKEAVKPEVKVESKKVSVSVPKPELKKVTVEALKQTPAPVVKAPETVNIVGTPNYSLVAGTFAKRENAQLIVDSLSKLSYKPQIIEISKNNVSYFRVLAGSYNSLAEVRAKVLSLKAKGIESFLVPFSSP
ncbi:MAG: SPOR domain-containing protein [Candidatus Margulisiibacteriota bacterium]